MANSRPADSRGARFPTDVPQEALLPSPKNAISATLTPYRYYAGFSEAFVEALLETAPQRPSRVVDPWNGSGTTTRVARRLGIHSVGIDLNPAMAVVAKARSADRTDVPLARATLKAALAAERRLPVRRVTQGPIDDPLRVWFDDSTAATLRRLQLACLPARDPGNVPSWPAQHALLQTALFVIAREMMAPLVGSNVTWIRLPKSSDDRVAVAAQDLMNRFEDVCDRLFERTLDAPNLGDVDFAVASATTLHMAHSAIPFFLTSPPYCTRLDYAVATRPELSVLGLTMAQQDRLRRQLMGRTTVDRSVIVEPRAFGATAERALSNVAAHTSKASATYYWKWLAQYFAAYSAAVASMTGAAGNESRAVVVVQDSYYKDVHIDLSAITVELFEGHGWAVEAVDRFPVTASMATVNTRHRKYRAPGGLSEDVLQFTRS